MGTYNLPRNVKGEGRILFIFTTKSMMYTGAFAIVGVLIYILLAYLNMKPVGLIIILAFALTGFAIGSLKVPNLSGIKWAKANAGENLDDVIKRAITFKKKGNKIYIYKEEKTNDD